MCDVTEKNRYNQDLVIDLTQQTKSLEAQVQSLKIEKSRINAEYQLCKTNLENYENEKLELVYILNKFNSNLKTKFIFKKRSPKQGFCSIFKSTSRSFNKRKSIELNSSKRISETK